MSYVAQEPTVEIDSTVSTWGNSLAVRLNKSIASTSGIKDGAPIHVIAQPGRIVIEVETKRKTLSEMLAAFNPEKHSREEMAFRPVGQEVL